MPQSDAGSPPIAVSIVVPVYSGSDYLERLIGEIEDLRNDWAERYDGLTVGEVILVDDDSIGTTPDVVDALAEKHTWVSALHLSRNFGQHAATIAGILHSAGDWVVTMDEDLQHPPSRIPELLKKAAETGADVVYASPDGRVHESVSRDWTSRLFKWAMRGLTGHKKLGYINSFRLLRGATARAAASVSMHNTYFDISLIWFTQRIESVPMTLKDERFIETGQSNYSAADLIGHARRMIFSSQLRVLRIGVWLGGTILLATVLVALWLFIYKLISPSAIPVVGWTSLILAICFFSSVMIMMLGIALEYISTLVLRAHGKPTFFVVDRSLDKVLATKILSGRS